MNTRRVVVTGASSGIGAASVRLFREHGWDVVGVARRADRLAALRADTGAAVFTADLTVQADVDALRDYLVETGPVHALVNNAGGAKGLDTVEAGSIEDWAWMFEINVLAVKRVITAVLPLLRAGIDSGAGSADIVNVTSIAGHVAYLGGGGYNAAKFAAHAMTEVLRLELSGEPIRVIEIAPGMVKTDEFGLVRFNGDADKAFAAYDNVPDPLSAEDIAETIVSSVERPAALRMQGFSVVDVGGVAQVVPEADAKLLGGPIYNASNPGGNGMQTRTFRLQYENAVNLIPVLRPIVSPNNPINAYPGNNSIVITDYAENLARVAQIIDGIDTPSAIDTDVVAVQNGIAVDIAAMVSQLLETQGSDQTQKINVIGDPRSNSIIIRAGSPERTELARNLIYKLDNAQSNPSNMHVVYLRNAQAGKLAQSLRGLLTGESESGTSDNARSKLSTMGGSGQNGQGSTQNSSGTPTGSGVQSANAGYGQDAGSTSSASHSPSDQSTAFSAGGVTIQADATTNTLLISAPEPLYRNLREVIDMLDQRRAQVVIESLIVEVGEDDASEFGVQWQAGNLGGKGGFGGVNLGGSGLNGTPDIKTSIDVLPKGLNIGLVDGTVDIPGIGKVLDLKVLARALKSKGGTNVLSTPNLLTLDNEAASIFVGQTIPFVTGSYVTGGGGTSNNPFQTVQREEVGLKLNVRPQISEGGTVKLDIYQEVSSVDARASVAGTVTNKRAIDTSILLDDGQIMVLGGLLQDGYSQSNDAVPWLSDIPGLGALFRNEKRSVTKTNLMVFLRPYIIRDSGAGRSITLNRYEFMRRAQGGLQPERSWAMPDVQAPQLPSVHKAIPEAGQEPRAVIRAVPVQGGARP